MAGLGEILGQMFGGLASADNGVHIKVWHELKPWVAALVPNATSKWIPSIAGDVACEIPVMRRGAESDCSRHAVACCDVCHRPTCLGHGRIDALGDIICYQCVADALQLVPPARRARAAQQPPRPRPQEQQEAPPPQPGKPPPTYFEIVAAFGVLNLKPGSPFAAIKSAHRKLSAQHHPDKQRSSAKKAAAEGRFKQIQAAYEVLKRAHPEAT